MPHRYFTTEIADGTAVLRGTDAHHLARVMRARMGDTVILCDGSAVEYTATITGFGDDCVEFSVEPGVLPDVALPLPNFGAVCRTFDQYDLVLFCYECGGAPVRQLLAEAAPADGKKRKIAIITGAEGGFAAEEAEMAAKAGAKTVGLGPRILRCETAPLAVLAAVMTLTGNLE